MGNRTICRMKLLGDCRGRIGALSGLSVLMALAAFQVPSRAAAVEGESGVEWVSFHYEEPGEASMREDGMMFGVFGSCTWNLEKMKVRAAASFTSGTLDYDGWFIDSDTGERLSSVRLRSPNSVFGLRATAGPKFKVEAARLTICPMAGLGLRYLINDLPGIGGYTREQTYIYLPIGIEASGSLARGWGYVVRAEFDCFLYGYNVSGGDSFSQNAGYGFDVSAGVAHALPGNGSVSVRVEPFFRYWSVDDSSFSPEGWYEPANNCSEYGIRCSILF